MITVAVAGGTSPALGRSILEALKQYPNEIKPVVLSRNTSHTPQWLDHLAIEVRRVDYESDDSLREALRDVHTLICTLLPRDGTWASTQIRLLGVCLRLGVPRFVPAGFGPGLLAAQHVSMLEPLSTVIQACRVAKAQHPPFEYATFSVGVFMNYLGYGAPNEEEALHGFNDNWRDIWWHVKEMRANIPLTKERKVPEVTMTEIRDVGRFVATACLLPKGSWSEEMSMVGQTLSINEVVEIVEKVRGAKMEVEYKPFEKIVECKEAEQDSYRKFWYELEEMIAKSRLGEGIVEPVLNGLCPSVRPIRIEEYVRKYWGQG